ncbi:MAG: T9SS type A sorting domain-containing protein [bacterium]|nr:T9SS type A sorting domain-containing protein [bacterium]
MRTRLASVFLAIILSGTALADGWRPGFGLPGFDGPVQALAEYEGDLYVAGKFAVASGTSAPRIARWNGAQWVDLGIEFGYNDEVCALLVHEGSLIVSGKFYFQDNTGAYCRSIARWDGTQWHAMGDGFSNNFVRALGLDPDGNLIAGGSMYYSGSTAVRNIARWTGAAWAPLGSGLYSEVYDIEVYNGELVASGRIYNDYAGHTLCGVARWTAEGWVGFSQPHPASGGIVYDLEVRDGYLYAGGDFNAIESATAHRLARWDGATWTAVPGVPSDVWVKTVDSAGNDFVLSGTRGNSGAWDSIADGVEMLISQVLPYGGGWAFGGEFATAGGALVAPNFVLWDGAQWSLPVVTCRGMNGPVRAFAEYQGRLIAGGEFTAAGIVPADHLAAWDGDEWEEIGGGVSGVVSHLASDGTSLYAAGAFLQAGGEPAARIVRWDGSEFHTLGSGLDGVVNALAIWMGDLIAAGEFSVAGGAPVNHIARWNGSQWSALGAGVDGVVHALCVHEGQLVVGGDFEQAGGGAAANLAVWNGSNWSEYGGGAEDAVRALVDYQGDLVAGGAFTMIGGVGASLIARENGGGWEPMGSGFADQYCWPSSPDGETCVDLFVSTLAAVGDKLYANGSSPVGGVEFAGVVRWDDRNHWMAMDSGIAGSPDCLLEWDGALYVGGSFAMAGGIPASNITVWDEPVALPGNAEQWWAGFDANGPDNRVSALTTYNDQLIVAGRFEAVGGLELGGVAAWDGDAWVALGAGFGVAGVNVPHVRDVVEYQGDLYAAGLFSVPPSSDYCNLARWDGAEWDAIGLPGAPSSAMALVVFGDKLIIGGSFAAMDGEPASNIVAWNGATFSPLGSGLNSWVSDLAVYRGELVAAGHFTNAGGQPVQYLAIWNGSEWDTPAGFTAGYDVQSLTANDNDLYLGGRFNVAGGQPIRCVARWDGVAFSPLGSGMGPGTPDIWDLEWWNGALHAAGSFTESNGHPVRRLAAWDGSEWTEFGGGADDVATVIASWNGDLYWGGEFRTVGGKNSPRIGRWLAGIAAVDLIPGAGLHFDAAYPNPFNPSSTIEFTVPTTAPVRLAIYDSRGRLVRIVVDEILAAGPQMRVWDGRDTSGRPVGSGVYLVRLQANGQSDVRKVTLLK